MIQLSDQEFKIIQDKELLITKANAISKIEGILSETRNKLRKSLSESSLTFPEKTLFKTNKISRGENYLGLPYLVLDYPAIFSKEDIFAFRSMFWWGNFFSSTLHLEGKFLHHYRKKIIKNLELLKDQDVYIGIGDSPWHYHYGNDNYELLADSHYKHIEKCTFLKISKKFELNECESFPEYAVNFFNQMVFILTNPVGE